MATIRVKRSTLSSAPTGLTFGEPAFVDGLNSFYITKNNGTSLRVGAEVDSSTSLGTSNNKIPTQGAVKSYVDSVVTGGDSLVNSVNGFTGAVSIVSGNSIAVSSSSKSITINNTGVFSVNGATGTVTNVAKTNTTNTFTPLQTFSAGILSTGATFDSGLITVKPGLITYGGDSGIVRVVGSDISETIYNSDIRANAAATANTTHTLPATTGTLLNTNSAYVSGITGTANQITASASTGSVTLSLPSTVTVPGALNVTTDLTVTGNLTVNGSTTTVNSDTITVDDPIITLGLSGGVPISVSDGGKDRGLAFTYFDSTGKTGFFGWDASASQFIFAGNASVSSESVTVTSFSPVQASDVKLYSSSNSVNGVLTPTTLTSERTYTLPDHAGTVVVPSDLGSSNYILKANGTTSQPTWVAQSTLSVGSASTLTTGRTIGLTGDVSGSASFDGSSDINITATIAPNSVALGDDTTGNYVATLSTSSTGLSIANSGSESAAVTVNFSTITSGLNMGTFSFATGEFTNSSGTVSIGTVDGGTFT